MALDALRFLEPVTARCMQWVRAWRWWLDGWAWVGNPRPSRLHFRVFAPSNESELFAFALFILFSGCVTVLCL